MDSSSSNNNDQSNSNKSVVVKKNRYGKIVKVNDKGNKSKSKHGAGHVASTSMAVDASERKKRSASVDEDNNNNNFDSTSAIASQANSSSSSAAALSSSSASSSKKQPLKKKTRAKASGNDMETDDKRKNNITTTNSGHNNNSSSNNDDDDDLDEDMVEDEFEEEVQITSEEQNELGEDDDDEDDNKNVALFRPGVDELEEGEKLDYDPSTYVMLHRMQFDWSCFSFDFLKDNYGPLRTRFPLSTFIVAGTQAAEADGNQLIITKLSDMNKTRFREDADDGEMSDDDDDEGVDDDPVIQTKKIKHVGGVNRVRSMPQKSEIVATWSETGSVFIWDLSSKLKTMNFFVEDIKSIPTSAQDVEAMLSKDLSPIFTFKGHKDEGFAMDWSIARPGRFASADLRKSIYIWDISSSGITVDPKPFNSHDGSVEDVQWSPNEETVLASCSVDQTVRIWDIRQKKSQMLSVHAHDTDVNVLSWNPTVSYLLVSGADDGSFKVWDLRKFKETESIGHFKWHTGPITSIQWNPNDESVLAVTGDDNQTSIWDLALEDDPEHARATAGLDEAAYDLHGNQLSIPPQLLFLHQGQTNPKDVRFHPQIPGLVGTTAEDGFNVFICEPFDYLYKTKSAKV